VETGCRGGQGSPKAVAPSEEEFREFIEFTFQLLTEAVFHIINFILCWGMNVQKNGDTCNPLSIMH
jgi:hypothetical protein